MCVREGGLSRDVRWRREPQGEGSPNTERLCSRRLPGLRPDSPAAPPAGGALCPLRPKGAAGRCSELQVTQDMRGAPSKLWKLLCGNSKGPSGTAHRGRGRAVSDVNQRQASMPLETRTPLPSTSKETPVFKSQSHQMPFPFRSRGRSLGNCCAGHAGRGQRVPIALSACTCRSAPLLTPHAPAQGTGTPALSPQDPVPSSVTREGDRTVGRSPEPGVELWPLDPTAPSWCQGPSGASVVSPGGVASPSAPLLPPGREERTVMQSRGEGGCAHMCSPCALCLHGWDIGALTRRSQEEQRPR